MLPRQMFRAALTVAVVLSMSTASAQFYNKGCSSCVPIQPVQTTCYQTVPVTTYRQEKQTVQEPYYQTAYEDREVTVMRPVTVRREVEVPTVSYRTVTEQRTVERDMGRWMTRYTPVQKYAPCQVDPRPGLIGWLNRTGYSFRTAFMPNYYTSRQYVPNRMACTVPVSRQVAVRGTRRVTVNETKMVAEKKTERVAVQKLRYRNRVVSVMKPQTAYRTVPIGTQTAFGYGGYGYGAQTAFAPMIIDSTRTAELDPQPDTIGDGRRSARNEKDMFERDGDPPKHARDDDHFDRASLSRELEPIDDNTLIFEGESRRSSSSNQLIIPATYTQPAQSTPSVGHHGWTQTSRKTAMRSNQKPASSLSQVTLTQKSEN